MKRNLFIVIVAAVMWACSQTDEPQMPTQSIKDEQTALTGTRTPEEAKACAIEAFTSFYGMSRALPIVKDVNVYGTGGLGRSTDSDTTFYVVNLEDNGGYAVIAADRQEQPVLAVTEAGNIEDIDSIENPGAKMFFNALKSRSIGGNFHPIDSTTIIRPIYDINYEYKTTSSESKKTYGPNADLAWGQDYPEGMYFPNKVAGCGNIATVLAMSYFEEPKVVKDFDGSIFEINWSIIKRHKYSGEWSEYDGCNNMTDGDPHALLARLCYFISKKNKSQYKKGQTPTTLENIHSTFNNLCTTLYISDIVQDVPNGSILLSKGILVVGAKEEKEGVGHAFVIDGYKIHTITESVFRRNILTASPYWELVSTSIYSTEWNHINWGWCGRDNGYYNLRVFKNSDGNYCDDMEYFMVCKSL